MFLFPIRFASEVAGVDDLGTTGRGGDMQVCYGTCELKEDFYIFKKKNVIITCEFVSAM